MVFDFPQDDVMIKSPEQIIHQTQKPFPNEQVQANTDQGKVSMDKVIGISKTVDSKTETQGRKQSVQITNIDGYGVEDTEQLEFTTLTHV